MLNQTHQKFEKIKRILLKQKQNVEEELKRVEKEDPLYADALAETSESGTASWIADVHSKALAVKENLLQMLDWTKHSLANLNSGKYGKCEKCGQDIEIKRLEAMPTATLCVSCSKKSSKK